MAADHDINRLSQALQVAITAEDERGKHVSTTQPTCDGSKIATTEKSRGLPARCTPSCHHDSSLLIRRLAARHGL